MRKIHHEIQKIINARPMKSYADKRNCEKLGHAFGNWAEKHFPGLQLNNLKQKHLLGYLDFKKSQNLGVGHQKNIASTLRTLCRGIDKANLLPRDNAALDIPNRISYATVNRAAYLNQEQLEALEGINPSYRLAAEAQMAMGLRAQEAGKFDPKFADRVNYIKLKGSWCKSGRERAIDVNLAIREWLDKVKSIRNQGESIADRQIHNWYQGYLRALNKVAGITTHDLRHGWFHKNYERLTGYKPPIAGGPKWNTLGKEERRNVQNAADWLSDQSGHGRRYVVSHYIGKLR